MAYQKKHSVSSVLLFVGEDVARSRTSLVKNVRHIGVALFFLAVAYLILADGAKVVVMSMGTLSLFMFTILPPLAKRKYLRSFRPDNR